MRILVHDYTGHAFQADLSRQLAALGHEVCHLTCASFPAPKGLLERVEGDAQGLSFATLSLKGAFDKQSFARRWWQERQYGKDLAAFVAAWAPDVALVGNTPLDALLLVARRFDRDGVPWVFWQQDIYSVAISRYLTQRLGLVGRVIGFRYRRMEAVLARRAAAVVPISQAFVEHLLAWGVAREGIRVERNWAPLDQLPLVDRDNPWAQAHGLVGKRVLLYAGTIGLKHEPVKLVSLARAFRERPDVVVLVVSSGPAARLLERQAQEESIENLRLLPFQPVEDVASMLASADVLLSVLEAGAGVFCVPSKVLSQLCAGRCLLASLPAENDAAGLIEASGAGLVVDPNDQASWVNAARELVDDPKRCARAGDRARAFAEQAFDSSAIALRFEALLLDRVGSCQRD